MTGADETAASMYLEMAGGNLEIAVCIFFDGGDGGGSGAALQPAPAAEAAAAEEDAQGAATRALLGSSGSAFPAAWLDQGLAAETERGELVVSQRGNGPCGVLAAAHALAITLARARGCDGATALRLAAATMIATCGGAEGPSRAKVARWAGEAGGRLEVDACEADAAAVAALLADDRLCGRGGVVLLCYSCVLSRGVATVAADAAVDGGSLPLVYGPFHLCTTELLNLVLFGAARGDVGCYGGGGGRTAWRGAAATVGLLSLDEVESGVPVADELKSPSGDAWVVHGGSHFTTLWAKRDGGGDGGLAFFHWNGLRPNRRLTELRLAPATLARPPPSPETWRPTRYRLVVGELESVVQAHPEDKRARPNAWRGHRYELALATQAHVDDDAGTPPRPAGTPPPETFAVGAPPAPGAKWRCAACYKDRFRTMCFGENAPNSEGDPDPPCRFCATPRSLAGHTIWRRFDDLPAAAKRRVDRNSGPKILAVLRTRWPDAELLLQEGGAFRPAAECEEAEPPAI